MKVKSLNDLYFNNPALFIQAMSHTSYVNEHAEEGITSNQRLEFLGDAALGLIVAKELFRTCPEMNEGALTELRSQLVRGQALAIVARRLNLCNHIMLGQGEGTTGGYDRDSNLAAALEALVGAMLLDQGYDLTERFVLHILEPEFSDILSRTVQKDPKSRLQEWLQHNGHDSPQYNVETVDGPAHRRQFTVQVIVKGTIIGAGQGKNKVTAEQQAAIKALYHLEGP